MVEINNNILRQPPQPVRQPPQPVGRPQPMRQPPQPMGRPQPMRQARQMPMRQAPQMPMRQAPQMPMGRPQPLALRAKRFQEAAIKNPLDAMRMAGISPKPVPPMNTQGLGTLPSNVSLSPTPKLDSNFNLNKDVLRPITKAAVASLVNNLDKETKQELEEGTKEVVDISSIGRQSIGNKFPHLDSSTYKDMSEEEIKIKAASGGGLMPLAARQEGGKFTGIVPGEGHGMQDNVYMPVEEKGEQVATLAVSPKEYVVDAYTMAALGNGNADQGARYMDAMVENIREQAYGTNQQPNQIDGLAALRPMMERV